MDRNTELLAASSDMDERNDCAVRAVAVATGVSYQTAHAALRVQGRKDRDGTYPCETHKAVQSLRFQLEDVTEQYAGKREYRTRKFWSIDRWGYEYEQERTTATRLGPVKTVTTAEKYLPKDRVFIVFVREHVLCVRDGKAQDCTSGRRHHVKSIYRVTRTEGS